jgi:hypothetical protein
MKKLIFVLVIAFLAINAVSAQNWGNQWEMGQSVTVEGTLQLQNGQIAVSAGNTLYFVPVLNRYIGFIDGLREGTRVSVLGYASGNVFQAIQVTINGKSYDFPSLDNCSIAPGYANYNGYGSCCSGWGTGGLGRRW